MIRVVLPYHLRNLARVEGEVEFEVASPVTLLDAGVSATSSLALPGTSFKAGAMRVTFPIALDANTFSDAAMFTQQGPAGMSRSEDFCAAKPKKLCPSIVSGRLSRIHVVGAPRFTRLGRAQGAAASLARSLAGAPKGEPKSHCETTVWTRPAVSRVKRGAPPTALFRLRCARPKACSRCADRGCYDGCD